MDFLITYQKENGQVLLRTRQSLYGMKIGDITSMGWKVLDIRENYCGNYMHHADIRKYRRNKLGKIPTWKKIVRYIVKKLNKLT